MLQILLAVALRPKKTKQLRRYWNLSHWTLGRAALLLAVANIFIGMYISHVAYKNIIAQAVVLGGLFIIYMLKRDVDYLRVPVVPAEEERLLSEAYGHGTFLKSACRVWHLNLTALPGMDGLASGHNIFCCKHA